MVSSAVTLYDHILCFSFSFLVLFFICNLQIYFLVVVYSFHEALREDPSGATAGYSPANAPVRNGKSCS